VLMIQWSPGARKKRRPPQNPFSHPAPSGWAGRAVRL